MPELPETETIARDLDAALRGATIAGVDVPRPSVLRGVDAAELARRTAGVDILRVWRRAKLVVLDLSTGDRIAIQPRFTGTVLLDGFATPFPEAERRFVRVTFRLTDDRDGSQRAFHYRDIRALGTVALLAPAEFDAHAARLGPEPLDPAFTADALGRAIGRSAQPVKRVLMDQQRLAGVGNIYANEALWAARIHPARPASSLTAGELRALRDAVVAALSESVALGGTTFENFLSPLGRRGRYVDHLKAYGRGGAPCARCADALAETHAIDGRSTVFCARCQSAAAPVPNDPVPSASVPNAPRGRTLTPAPHGPASHAQPPVSAHSEFGPGAVPVDEFYGADDAPGGAPNGVPAIVAAALASAADAHLPALRDYVRANAHDRPGVYRMLGESGEVIYVGKSKHVRTRLLSYFRCVYPDEKGARILRDACHLEWEYAPSEFAALLLELRLIKRLRPRYNVAMKHDARHWSFIKLTRGAAPKLQVVKGSTGSADGGVYYGPFRGADQVGEAVRELSDALGLRDCANDVPMRFGDQRELFSGAALDLVQIGLRTPRCLRHEIRKCLGPCVGACTVGEYRGRVALARAFLDGSDDAPLAMLRADMEASAERLEFERAAHLRDKVRRLELLQAQFDRLRFAVETLSFAYVVPGDPGKVPQRRRRVAEAAPADAGSRVYLVRRGRVRAEHPVPTDATSAAALAEDARRIYGSREQRSGAVPTHEVDELLLLSSWFRHRDGELARTALPRQLLAHAPEAAWWRARLEAASAQPIVPTAEVAAFGKAPDLDAGTQDEIASAA